MSGRALVRAMRGGAAELRAWWVRRVLRRPVRFRDRYGLRYLLYPTDDLALYFRHRGWFEEPEQAFCARWLGPGMVAVDAGAYLGAYALLMARCVGPAGQVHAFEPAAASVERLERHLALNGVRHVRVVRAALGARPGRATLRVYPSPWESLSRLDGAPVRRGGVVIPPAAEEVVEVVRLDDYCAAHGIERVDLWKLDVEGAELEALEGARGLVARGAVRALLVEVGERIAAVLAWLEARGFTCYLPAPDGTLAVAGPEAIRTRANVVALRHAGGR
jgi:FkbM family methyltransferase